MDDAVFSLWVQNEKGIVKAIKSKPRRKHDAYAYEGGIIYLIWYEEFEEGVD